MKETNLKKKELKDAYIPFNIDKIDQEVTPDSLLILDDGTYFMGRSFGSKRTSIEWTFNYERKWDIKGTSK